MPGDAYDRYFGGKVGSAARALAGMRQQYGDQEGERVFRATVSKRRAAGKGKGVAAVLREQHRRGR